MMKSIKSLFLLFLLLLCGFNNHVEAQKIITYDFSNNKFSSPSKNIATDDVVQVKVININRFLYDVKVEIENKELISQPLKILDFQAIALKRFDVSNMSLLKGRSKITEVGMCSQVLEEYEYLSRIEKELFAQSLKLEKTIIADSDIKDLLNFDGVKLADDGLLSVIRIQNYTRLNPENSCIAEANKEWGVSKIKSELLAYSKIFNRVSGSSFEYVSGKIFVLGDILDVTVSFAQKKPETFNQPSVTKRYDVLSTGWRTSFSGGIFVGANSGDTLYNYQAFTSSDATLRYRLVAEDTDKVDVGLTSFIHLTKRFDQEDTYARWGLFFGAAVPINQINNSQISVGPCFTFGQRRQVVLNAGLAVGYRKEPSETIDTSIVFPSFDFPISYVPKIKCAGILSLTFNVFKIKE